MNALALVSPKLKKPVESTSLNESVRGVLAEYVRRTEFKRILNQIVALQLDEKAKSLAILSYFPGEGKTFFVAALALAYVKFLNGRVLIVDTTNQTSKRSLFLECILNESGQSAKLPGTTSGRIDLITGANFEQKDNDCADFHIGPYVDQIKQDYDLVLLDTCAVAKADCNNMDPLIVARFVDAALLVTSPRSLQHEILTRMRKITERYEIRLVGSIFNREGLK